VEGPRTLPRPRNELHRSASAESSIAHGWIHVGLTEACVTSDLKADPIDRHVGEEPASKTEPTTTEAIDRTLHEGADYSLCLFLKSGRNILGGVPDQTRDKFLAGQFRRELVSIPSQRPSEVGKQSLMVS